MFEEQSLLTGLFLGDLRLGNGIEHPRGFKGMLFGGIWRIFKCKQSHQRHTSDGADK